jgi:DNA primase small subunit
MSEQEVDFVERKFNEYYSQGNIILPSQIELREFGFLPFKDKMMIRHKGFQTLIEYTDFIVALTPAHAYYSAAYYESPEEPMNRKKWLRADLVFDIDLDHLESPCKNRHDFWICDSCHKASTRPNGKCPHCGSGKIKKEAWLCETCLEVAKTETIKLMNFLMTDFGFPQNEVEVNFSGHRGYHVHVKEREVTFLDQAARKEIVDYLLGTSLKVEYHGVSEITEKRISGPELSDLGWRGRIARGIYDFLLTASPQQLEEIEGLDKSFIRRIILSKDRILNMWSQRAPWGLIKGIGIKTWQKLAELGIKKQSSKIDTVVTTDIHRLIRISHSLHGKTGLKAISISPNSLEKFDPLNEAIAFSKGYLKVFVIEAHQFRLKDEVFGPFKQEIVELPMAAAIYLLCKKAAKICTRSAKSIT